MSSGGLGNLGQTCAVNALIQCITHTPLLRNYFLNNEFDTTTIAYQIKDVIQLLYVQHSTVAPRALLYVLYKVFSKMLQPGEQHDICELWMLISDKIAEDVGEPLPPPPNPLDNDPNNLENKLHHVIYNSNNKKISPWIKYIQGVQISLLQCSNPSCLEKYNNPEVFTTLTVDIPKKGTHELKDLLLQFYRIETLDVEGWKCDKCQQQIGAKKQIQLVKLPKILIIVIKRFAMTATGEFAKIIQPVHIDSELEFTFNNKTSKYSLFAVGNHYGNYNGGHYTASARDENDPFKWINYDDTNVNPLQNLEFLKDNKEAYILFYQM
jgi:ubiquitin C-terminal hydrolase